MGVCNRVVEGARSQAEPYCSGGRLWGKMAVEGSGEECRGGVKLGYQSYFIF